MATDEDVTSLEQDLAIKIGEAAELCDALIEVAKQAGKDDRYIQSLKEKLQAIRNI